MTEYADPNALKEHIETVVQFPTEKARAPIKATPFVYRHPSLIPRRENIYGRHYVRKFVSGTVSPGGTGKSSQALVEAVAMATGRDLLGVPARAPLRVWYWCGEDPMDELERRVAGILLHYRIDPSDLGDRLFLDSGRDTSIVVANEAKDGTIIAEPVIADLEATLLENRIDVWTLDPFVSCHAVSENDNTRVAAIMKAFGGLVDRTNTAAELVHHSRKNMNGEITAEDSRGAKAFVDGVRSLRTLNRMTEEEAARFGVSDEDRVKIFRADIGKGNLFAASTKSAWRYLASVGLGNSTAVTEPEDFVGVVTRWEAPGLFDGITPHDVLRVQNAIAKGEYRESVQATAWVGHVVAETLDLDISEAKDRVKEMLRSWLKAGLLKVERRRDSTRQERTFIVVGKYIEP